jgi:hypothetical protein
MLWKDASSYSKSDTDRSPNCWVAKAGNLRLTLHRHIHYPKDTWLLSCAPFFDKRVLLSKDIVEAKSEALSLVRPEIQKVALALAAAP